MARTRNHQQVYAARNERARQLGFTGYSQQRRFQEAGGREQIGTSDFARASEYASQRRNVQSAVATYRRNQPVNIDEETGESYETPGETQPSTFDQILELFGLSQPQAQYWAPEAFDPETGEPLPTDTGHRLLTALVAPGQTAQVDVYSSEEASMIGRHFAAISDYLRTGDEDLLTPFVGVTIDGYELEADPLVLEYLYSTGELVGVNPYSSYEN